MRPYPPDTSEADVITFKGYKPLKISWGAIITELKNMTILTIYFIFFAAEYLFENYLEILNMNNVKKHKTVPDYFKDTVKEDTYRKSADYTIEKTRFTIISSLFSSGFLVFFILSGLFGTLEEIILSFSFSPYIEWIIYIFAVTAVFNIVSIPFSVYSSFVIEAKYGFNKMTVKLFITDMIKGSLLSIIIGFPILLILFWFMDKAGSMWWIYAFVFISVIQIGLNVLYPVLIAPLFNKFEVLEEGDLKSRLDNLADKLSFKVKGIFKVDGSRRSSHSNAYFTGFGKLKRIVLYDTLIESLSPEEIEAVLAHEIGHEKLKHVVKRIFVSLLMMFLTLFVIDRMISFDSLFTAFGFSGSSYYGTLILISLCSSPFTFFLNPVFTSWSRKHEYEADSFAVKSVENRESLKNALLKLGSENLSNLTPHPLYSFYHYSHPALNERLEAIDKL